MKVVSRVGCKHLQGSISNVTISKQDHKKIFIFGLVQGSAKIRSERTRSKDQDQNYIRPSGPEVRVGCLRN